METLFAHGPASDPLFEFYRSDGSRETEQIRADCNEMWAIFRPYADPDFSSQIRHEFLARYWEMYLTTFLIRQGHSVCCPKPGPDVGIQFGGRRIWFEATTPTPGIPGHPDEVPPIKYGEVQDVPNEKLLLRYLNSIDAKCTEQYPKWIKAGCISEDDALIVAINPHLLRQDYVDTTPPRILQAAVAIGNPYVQINRATMQCTGAGYELRTRVVKSNGASVDTGVFGREEYAMLSGLLCGRVDPENHPVEMGGSFQLVPNPAARIVLPADFRLLGTFYPVKLLDDQFEIGSAEYRLGREQA